MEAGCPSVASAWYSWGFPTIHGSFLPAVKHGANLLCPNVFNNNVLPILVLTAYIHSNQIMGWGEKAIEIRSVETGHLDGVFMHKRAQRLKFLCERNDKVNLLQGGCRYRTSLFFFDIFMLNVDDFFF